MILSFNGELCSGEFRADHMEGKTSFYPEKQRQQYIEWYESIVTHLVKGQD